MFCDLILEHYEENVGPYWPYVNMMRPYSLIYYVVKGSGTYTLNGKTSPFIKNNLYIFPPNTNISLDYDKEDELRIMFVHAYISPTQTQLIHVDVPNDKFLEYVIKLMRMYVKKPDNIYTRKLTEMLVSYVFEKYNEKISSIGIDIKNYIDQNYIDVYKNGNLSHVFNYSNSHILKIFKDEYNTTPRKYALKLLLQHIFSLLREGIPVNQISASLEFSSPENFSKFFKKNYGCSPSMIAKKYTQTKI